MRNITKTFPGVRALDGVSFHLYSGEVHALVGENGAGKSTLIKILGGIHTDYGGEILITGTMRRFDDVHDSAQAGIAIVHQELSLVPEMAVAENIFLGREPRQLGVIRWHDLYAKAQRVLDELHLKIGSRTRAIELGIGQQQLVEIAKALTQEARILVLDEPTAALTDSEVDTLFGILERLRSRGIGIIYISHKLNEVLRLSNRVTVLRDGKSLGTSDTSQTTESGMISKMVGREVTQVFPRATHTPGDVVFEVRDLTLEDPNRPGRLLVNKVSFSVGKGEVLGIAGLMGAGRSELLMAIFGAHAGRRSGEIYSGGAKIDIHSPGEAIAAGIGFVTEDRKRYGLFLDDTIVHNMTLVCLKRLAGKFVTNAHREAGAAERAMRELRIKANSPYTIARTLSGGTQQKVVLSKWLLADLKVLLLDEPTRGIDIGAKQEMYWLINELAAKGLGIVLVSSELPEVLGLSDRILVLHQGRINGAFTSQNATAEAVMACATGAA